MRLSTTKIHVNTPAMLWAGLTLLPDIFIVGIPHTTPRTELRVTADTTVSFTRYHYPCRRASPASHRTVRKILLALLEGDLAFSKGKNNLKCYFLFFLCFADVFILSCCIFDIYKKYKVCGLNEEVTSVLPNPRNCLYCASAVSGEL